MAVRTSVPERSRRRRRRFDDQTDASVAPVVAPPERTAAAEAARIAVGKMVDELVEAVLWTNAVQRKCCKTAGLKCLQHQQWAGPLSNEPPTSLPAEQATPGVGIEVATVTPWAEVDATTRPRPPCPPNALNAAVHCGAREATLPLGRALLVQRRGLEVRVASSLGKALAAAAHKTVGPLGPAVAVAVAHAI